MYTVVYFMLLYSAVVRYLVLLKVSRLQSSICCHQTVLFHSMQLHSHISDANNIDKATSEVLLVHIINMELSFSEQPSDQTVI